MRLGPAGSLLTVFRVDSGAMYRSSTSTDRGATWSAPATLPFGSVRPKLLLLGNGSAMLAGGRPQLLLAVSDAKGEAWRVTNVAAMHNALLADAPEMQACGRGGVG